MTSPGTMDETPITLIGVSSTTGVSAFSDDNAQDRAAGMADRVVAQGQACAAMRGQIAAIALRTMIDNPRVLSARMDGNADPIHRIRAMSTMPDELVDGFGDGDAATMTTRGEAAGLNAFRKGPDGAILAETTTSKPIVLTTMVIPGDADDLAQEIARMAAAQGHAVAVDDVGPDRRVHIARSTSTPRVLLTSLGVSGAKEGIAPFAFGQTAMILHPIAWAIIRGTAWRTLRSRWLCPANAARSTRRGTKPIRDLERDWSMAHETVNLEKSGRTPWRPLQESLQITETPDALHIDQAVAYVRAIEPEAVGRYLHALEACMTARRQGER